MAGSPPQRVEVCVDGADILRRLRTTSVSSAGLVGTTTLTLSPRP